MTCGSRGRSAALVVSIVAVPAAGPVAVCAWVRLLNETIAAAMTAPCAAARRQWIPFMRRFPNWSDGVKRLVDYPVGRESGIGKRETGSGTGDWGLGTGDSATQTDYWHQSSRSG